MNILEILKRNLGKNVTISAGYNDTFGEIINVDSVNNLVAIMPDKKHIKYIKIDKIYEITEEVKQ